MVTSVGIALGIAFFASVQTLRVSEHRGGVTNDAQLEWLVGTSLFMCLIGVMNSMLMSVTERFREIGTIKCLGASDGFIVKVFFLEAVLIGMLGSSVGAILGTSLTSIGLAFGGGGVALNHALAVIGIAVVIGIVMTVVAAVAPAIQAARMPAAVALRIDI